MYNKTRYILYSEEGVFEMFTDYLISTIQYIKYNLQVEAIGAIIIITLILLVMISIILLICRKIRLWYWKSNEQIEALESIDKNLEIIIKKLPDDFDKGQTLRLTESDNLEEKASLNKESEVGTNSVEILKEKPKITFDNKDNDGRIIDKPGYNIGKTGKIYAEDILREQIQF